MLISELESVVKLLTAVFMNGVLSISEININLVFLVGLCGASLVKSLQ